MNILRRGEESPYQLTEEFATAEEITRQSDFMQRAEALVSELRLRSGHIPSACVVTFGCQMNARDSEKITGVLQQAGFEITEDESADLVIYNTCTVRDNANQRVYGRLGALHAMKKKNPSKKIALCGCMVQEPSVIEKIRESYRFVNLIFGTHNIYKFPELLCRML